MTRQTYFDSTLQIKHTNIILKFFKLSTRDIHNMKIYSEKSANDIKEIGLSRIFIN